MRALTRFMLGLLAMTMLIAAGQEGSDPSQSSVELAPIHRDGRALENAALEVTRAFLREDAEAASNWLYTMEQNSRRLDLENDEEYGSTIVNYDQSFHVTLDRIREIISSGDMYRASDQYRWTLRSCIDCHRQAREQGLLPVRDQGLQSAG